MYKAINTPIIVCVAVYYVHVILASIPICIVYDIILILYMIIVIIIIIFIFVVIVYHRQSPFSSRSDASEKKKKNNIINRSERIIDIYIYYTYTISAPFYIRKFFSVDYAYYMYNIILYRIIYNTHIYIFLKCLRILSLGGSLPHTARRCQMPKNMTRPFKCHDETKTSTSELGGTILLLLLYYSYCITMLLLLVENTIALSNSDPHKLSHYFFPLKYSR